MKVLMIEDDKDTIEVIKLTLEDQYPETTVKSTDKGVVGLEKARNELFDVVVLDLGLPDIDGIKVLEQLRGFSKIPVLIISARHDPEEIVNALDLGAEDFILKPFACRTLLSSIQDISSFSQSKVEQTGKSQYREYFQFNVPEHEIIVREKKVKLSEAEWKLLDILIKHRGRIVPTKVLIKGVFDDRYTGEASLNLIIYLLRKKIEDDPDNPRIIVSEYGAGYRLLRPLKTGSSLHIKAGCNNLICN